MQTDEQIMQIFQDLREIYQTARQHNAETINQGEKTGAALPVPDRRTGTAG